jgi:S1-C subfamily serine protease
VLRPPRALSSAAPLLIAAAVGGGAALAGAEVTGVLDDSPTVVNTIEPPASTAPVSFAETKRLSINQAYRRSAPGVVQITASGGQTGDRNRALNRSGPREPRRRLLGSGFVIDKSGHIVTNFHVIEGAQRIAVSFSDRDSVEARVVGSDPSTDLAVLKVDVDSRGLMPLRLGNSDGVRVGDSVVAIGNASGLERSATAGIVSAVHRPLRTPNDFTVDDAIQTDAAIWSGTSGGPLVGAGGRVLGVSTAMDNSSAGATTGLGFAVPVNTMRDVASDLIGQGRVEHAFLGVDAQPIDADTARLFDLPVKRGVMVVRVYQGSGAHRAQLRAGTDDVVVAGESYRVGGDIIVEIDGAPVAGAEDLRDAISAKKPGDKIDVTVYRGDEERSVVVTLGPQPTRS